jgi:membrane-associated protease RseP (regulator of RpoE activity)
MDTIFFYDLAFLVLFTALAVIFLYKRRKNLKRQGLLYLYPTRIGINIIEKTSTKYAKILRPLQYVIIACGYILMVSVLLLTVKLTWNYFTTSIAEQVKVPILMPLIPYIDKIFNLSFLPPFYFTYWIIIIAVIAIPHEFAHGIFARLNKIKVHSTGFGFLGPFLAAFVEPDEKQLEKSKKFSQLSILAAGTFANIIFTLFSVILIWLFFITAFSASGVSFATYSYSIVNISDINEVNNIQINSVEQIGGLLSANLTQLVANNNTYFTTKSAFENSIDKKIDQIIVFDDSPALNAGLTGAITEIDGKSVQSYSQLRSAISSTTPGETVNVKTMKDGVVSDFQVTMQNKSGKSYLGIVTYDTSQIENQGLLSKLSLNSYRLLDPVKYNQFVNGVEYTSRIGSFGMFIYNLLWWLVLINLSVALVNMLPVGIFDGGRFFMITVWGITGSKKVGEYAFRVSTWILLGVIAALMIKWVFIFF